MVRPPLSAREHARGSRLGEALRLARGERTTVEVATAAGVSVETLRKIEHGRVPTPAFFTVVAIARAVDLPLDQLCEYANCDAAATGRGDPAITLSA